MRILGHSTCGHPEGILDGVVDAQVAMQCSGQWQMKGIARLQGATACHCGFASPARLGSCAA